MVQLCYRGDLQAIIGKPVETISASKVKDVLLFIKDSYGPIAAKEAKKMLIVVNNESILLRKVFNTPLKDGDVISFLPICSGG